MTRPKVLLVDDKESVVELLATILAPYELTKAYDGAQALEALDRHRFDVVVTDLRMPGVDGYQVLDAVNARSSETQVVVVTAHATVRDAVAMVKRGAYEYLPKPFDPDDVSLVVARAVEQRRQRQRAADGLGPELAAAPPVSMPYREAVEAGRQRASREYLVTLMRAFSGNVTRAAERAGMERESLHRVLKQYGIRSEEFKLPAAPRGART